MPRRGAQAGMPVRDPLLSKPQAVCGHFVHIHAPRIGIRQQRLPSGCRAQKARCCVAGRCSQRCAAVMLQGMLVFWLPHSAALADVCWETAALWWCSYVRITYAPAGTKQASSCSMAALRWETRAWAFQTGPLVVNIPCCCLKGACSML
jgi:hypothetical protein